MWYICLNITIIQKLQDFFISPWCRIYASVNWVSVGSDNGLSPSHYQIQCWNISIGPFRTSFSEFPIITQNFSFMKIHDVLNISRCWHLNLNLLYPCKFMKIVSCVFYNVFNKQLDRWMKGKTYRWTQRWMGGRRDRQKGRLMDRWTDRWTCRGDFVWGTLLSNFKKSSLTSTGIPL